jgi:hypothetical protein
MVVNDNWKLLPDADVLYACDGTWWDKYHAEVSAGFSGRCCTQDQDAARQYGLAYIESADFQGLCTEPGKIHTGNNSGFQAINLAYHLAATEIALVGYDMQLTGGQAHWFGNHPQGFDNPKPHNWIPAFNRLARDCERYGLKVVNCTRTTALECFEKVRLSTWLNDKRRET